MIPWSIGGLTDLPANAKLRKMQLNTDLLVQLINPMPQSSKQLLNVCPIPPVHHFFYQIGQIKCAKGPEGKCSKYRFRRSLGQHTAYSS